MMINKYHKYILSMLFVLVLLSLGHADDSIIIQNAWIPEAPPNAKVMAGYMTIENKSSRPRKLLSISSEQFKKVLMHKIEMHGDIMKMTPQEELEIPAQGSISLQPGGYHLMLMGPFSVLREGDKVTATLQFDNNQSMQIHLSVRSATDRKMMKGHH